MTTIVRRSGSAPVSAPARRWSRAAPAVVALPDLVIWATLCFSLVVALALLVGVFRPILVLPVGLVAVVLGARLRPPALTPNRPAVLGAAATMTIAVVWFLVQARHTGEAIGVGRDPSQYTLAGLYLIDHRAPDVTLPQSLVDLARAVPGLRTNFVSPDITAANHIQGTSLLPGMLAVFGWLFGTGGVFVAPAALGALALPAVYAMSRRIVGPAWAMLPVLALALTMPLAEFSRTPYTETLALVFAAGTVLGVWLTATDGRRSAALLAGGCAGAVMVARIDGGIVIVGGILGLALVAMATRDDELRQRRRLALALFVAAATVVGLIGWLDLRVHSPKYLKDLSNLLYPVLAGTAAMAVIGWILSGAVGARLIGRLRPGRRRWSVVGGLFAAAIALFLLTRPWWMVNHGQVNPDYWPAVQWRQRNEGLPLDGTQSYDEMTVTWMAWYYGWPLVLAGLGGGILATMTGIRRDTRLLAAAAIPAVAAAFYLNRISITADQIWAVRRLLPVIVPGLLLGAAYGLRALARWLAGARKRWLRLLSPVAVIGAAVVSVLPVLTWGPMFSPREGTGTYQLARELCAAADGGLIVQVGGYPAIGTMMPAVQQICPNTPAISSFSLYPGNLSQIVAAWHGPGPITVITFQQDGLYPVGVTAPAPWRTLRTPEWESVISHRPRQVNIATVQVWAARLDGVGHVRPLPVFPGLS